MLIQFIFNFLHSPVQVLWWGETQIIPQKIMWSVLRYILRSFPNMNQMAKSVNSNHAMWQESTLVHSHVRVCRSTHADYRKNIRTKHEK